MELSQSLIGNVVLSWQKETRSIACDRVSHLAHQEQSKSCPLLAHKDILFGDLT